MQKYGVIEMKHINNQEGFTLIEVIIALAVLAFGILSIMLMQVSVIKGNSTANTITNESNWAADQVEKLILLDYNDNILKDTTGDGTTGLNAETAATADQNYISPDGFYTIFWNIADDYPIIDSKRIRVIVLQNTGKSNKVVFEYTKIHI